MLLSELEFGSFLAYSPHGQDATSQASRVWVGRLKREQLVLDPPVAMSELVADRLRQRLVESRLDELLTPSCVLVPVPCSTLMRPGSLWVPLLIAKAFVRHGLGRAVEPCLERVSALRKSSISAAADRPRAREHYESLSCRKLVFPPDDIVLVDDVLTRGATALAAASRLREAHPRARIRAFAVVRTLSNPTEFQAMFDPCVGRIVLSEHGETFRTP